MNWEKWIKEMLEGEGLTGTVMYNECSDSYEISLKQFDVGLYPIWERYLGKHVRIKIEVLK